MHRNYRSTVSSIILLSVFLLAAMAMPVVAGMLPATPAVDKAIVGTGDAQIHVIPALSSPSVKNGEQVTITAIVTSKAAIKEVVADLGGIDKVVLKPASKDGNGRVGSYTANWTGHNLKDTVYSVAIRITDRNGHVYTDRSLSFSDPAAGTTTPGTNGYPADMPRQGTVLSTAVTWYMSGVIDTANHYAYMGTADSPAKIVKIALPGANGITTAPVQVASITLLAGEIQALGGAIDPVHNFAYFTLNTAVSTTQSKVVKINIDPASFGRVAGLPFINGDAASRKGVIDATGTYAYFGTTAAPGHVIKVNLSSFTEVGNIALLPSHTILHDALFEAGRGVNGTVYFDTYPGNNLLSTFVKVDCGAGDTAPALLSSITLSVANVAGGGVGAVNAQIDATRKIAWINGYDPIGSGGLGNPAVQGVDLETFTVLTSATQTGGSFKTPFASFLDTSGRYMYTALTADFTANSAVISKVAMMPGENPNSHASPPQLIGSIPQLNGNPAIALFDPATECLYFGTRTSPAKFVQVQLPKPNAPARNSAISLTGDTNIKTAIIDRTNGYAYFGTDTVPGTVIKVALGGGVTPPTKIATLSLATGENNIHSAIISANGQYGYFGTGTSPGKVVKVDLGTGSAAPTRIGAYTAPTGANDLACAAIDGLDRGIFGTNVAANAKALVLDLNSASTALPGALAFVLSMPTTVTHLTCAATCAPNDVIMGTSTSPGAVIRVFTGYFSDPLVMSATTLNAGENNLVSAACDGMGYAYFGTNTSPSKVIRVATGSDANPLQNFVPVSRISALPAGASTAGSIAMSGVTRAMCFGTDAGVVNEADLAGVTAGYPAVPTAQTITGSLALNAGETNLASVVTDNAGYAYFGTNTNPAQVIKVSIAPASAAPRQKSILPFPTMSYIKAGCVDTANGYAYFANSSYGGTDPESIQKVKLDGTNAPTASAALSLAANEANVYAAVADSANGYGYFCTYTSPAKVIKVKFNGASAPTKVGSLSLASGESSATCAVLDPTGTYLYVGMAANGAFDAPTSTSIAKVAVGAGDTVPTEVGTAIRLNEVGGKALYYNSADSQVVLVANSHLFAAGYSPSALAIVKIDASAMTVASEFEINQDGFQNAASGPGVFDPANKTVSVVSQWLGTAVMEKYYLGSGSAPTTLTAIAPLNSTPNTESGFSASLFDSASGYGYLLSAANPPSVMKVAMGTTNSLPIRVNNIPLSLDNMNADSFGGTGGALVQDPASGILYAGLYQTPTRVVQVTPSLRNYVHATKITVAEGASITDVRFLSQKNAGNVRLAIYDNSSPKRVLWKSGSVANSASPNLLVVPISSGTPAAMALVAGTYWLAWQTDSDADAASYVGGGNYGDGFSACQAYGTFTSLADSAITYNAERWSEHLTYAAATVNTLNVVSSQAGGTPDAGPNYVTSGSAVTASVPAVIAGPAGTQYVPTGWTGVGSVPASGTTNTVTFNISQDSTITWIWQTQYTLTATAQPLADGSVTLADGVTPATGWYAANSSFLVRAIGAVGFKLDQWSGDLGFSDPADTTITMNVPKVIQANFIEGLAPTGSIVINGGATTTTLPTVTLTLSATDTGGSGLALMRFSDDGSSWTGFEAYTTSRSYTLPAGTGPRTVYVEFMDNANNLSIPYTATIYLNGTAAVGNWWSLME